MFYDYEVFIYDWTVCFIDYQTNERYTIVNDKSKLLEFYNLYKDYVFIGYNNRQYDDYIFRGILMGMNPFYISDKLINKGMKGYRVIKSEDYPLISFDLSTGFHSLKQLEGFLGSLIKESSVPFDIDRKLTDLEIQEVLEYNIHDVEQTALVFGHLKKEYDSHVSLIDTFELSLDNFTRTKAQLSAIISGAVKQPIVLDDEFDISIPDTLKIERYTHVLDWYKNPINLTYKRGSTSNKLETMIAGCPHVFAYGGIHGALSNYIDDCSDGGIIAGFDVSSQYPSVMIRYSYTSRSMLTPDKYRELRDTRLKLKAVEDPREQPYKIVLNGNFGAMKDKFNPLVDPVNSNNTCIGGQLVILDLIEKIEDHCMILQSNTDGVFFKVKNRETLDLIKKIGKEWEERIGLGLDWIECTKIVQKDVNNYLLVTTKGKIKSKGAYVKELKATDFDLPILNKAVVDYFIQNKPVEDTINNCDDLIQFQKIVKVQGNYLHATHNNQILKEKVNRVFASTNPEDTTIFKVKIDGAIEKMANTPEHLFIDNSNIIGKKVPPTLDRQWYVDFALKRVDDFINGKDEISKEEKYQNLRCTITQIAKNHDSFYSFLASNKEQKYATTSELTLLIKLDAFEKYGLSLKLLTFLDYFNMLYGKKSPKIKTINDKILNKDIRILLEQYSTPTETAYSKLDSESVLIEIFNLIVDEDIHYAEKIKLQLEYEKTIRYVNSKLPIDHVYVVNHHEMNNFLICGYNLNNGIAKHLMIPKEIHRILACQEGDVLKAKSYEQRYAKKVIDKDEKGINIIGEDKNRLEYWLTSYEVIYRE